MISGSTVTNAVTAVSPGGFDSPGGWRRTIILVVWEFWFTFLGESEHEGGSSTNAFEDILRGELEMSTQLWLFLNCGIY